MEKLARRASRGISRGLAAARKLEPGLTRSEYILRRSKEEFMRKTNNQGIKAPALDPIPSMSVENRD